ncbi:hypothetical protein C8A06_1277 [Microbacteriaceae bacterium MWH-Ta3]|nr:hypothetical protein C8A06_1277 [Microbacteriaceae bacterium MWH-Ta3]
MKINAVLTVGLVTWVLSLVAGVITATFVNESLTIAAFWYVIVASFLVPFSMWQVSVSAQVLVVACWVGHFLVSGAPSPTRSRRVAWIRGLAFILIVSVLLVAALVDFKTAFAGSADVFIVTVAAILAVASVATILRVSRSLLRP